jgi:hypothetical protein
MASRRNPPKTKAKPPSQANQRPIGSQPQPQPVPMHNSSFMNMMPPNSVQHVCES